MYTKEQNAERAREWRKNNPDKAKANNLKYKSSRREEHNKKQKEYYKENKIHIIKRTRNYYKTEHGILMARKHRRLRRARLKQIKEVFTMDEWNKKLDETNGICPHCKEFIGKMKLTLDHIHPISKAEKGRIYTINDIQPLCIDCNNSKRTKLDWR